VSTESTPATVSCDPQAVDVETLFDVDSAGRRIDLDVAWEFLSTEAYWGRWRSREDFDTQVANAWRLVGAYRRSDGAMVGFARATSDGVSYAYLADVFVLPAARGHGLSKRMLAEMIERPPANTFRWALHTADAHGLYEKFGFAGPNDRYLERPGTH
jgi:GNAT superfamily N-acetyltransferase